MPPVQLPPQVSGQSTGVPGTRTAHNKSPFASYLTLCFMCNDPKLSQCILFNSLLKFLAKLQVCQAPELPLTIFPLLLPSRCISCAMILSSHNASCSTPSPSVWPNYRCAQHHNSCAKSPFASSLTLYCICHEPSCSASMVSMSVVAAV